MPQLLTPDLCVIGAGSGGLSAAAIAAAFGVPVVLIERGRMGGERRPVLRAECRLCGYVAPPAHLSKRGTCARL